MQSKTFLPVTALIALVAGGPLAWAQDSYDGGSRDSSTGGSTGDDAKTSRQAQQHPGNNTVAMAAAQPTTICNDRASTVACGAKSIPHEPGVPPVNPNPAQQAPAPAQ